MKISIEKTPADKAGRRSLRLVYNLGTIEGADGKKIRKRIREKLSLYIYDNPKNTQERHHNKEALKIAETIKVKRMFESQSAAHGLCDVTKQAASFFDYYDKIANAKAEGSRSNYIIWRSAGKHLRAYHRLPELTFSEITPAFLEGFKNYLKARQVIKRETSLTNSTQNLYFSKIRSAINEAYRDGIIKSNPLVKVKNIKMVQNKREYLTFDELKVMARTECKNTVLKRAFLFSCITGLRWSDIQKLVWKDFNDHKIAFNQKKIGGLQYLDLSQDALVLMGEQGEPQQRVFRGLKYSSWHNAILMQWACRAGITKHITFHSGRHTFAVLQLTQGTDIYTLSKLLGHSDLKTTQIYAEIIEQKRKNAINVIPNIFD